jgi:hypothetical protein
MWALLPMQLARRLYLRVLSHRIPDLHARRRMGEQEAPEHKNVSATGPALCPSIIGAGPGAYGLENRVIAKTNCVESRQMHLQSAGWRQRHDGRACDETVGVVADVVDEALALNVWIGTGCVLVGLTVPKPWR